MDDQTSGHYGIRGLNLCCSHKSPVSDSLLDQDLQGERQVSPVSDFHQGEPLLARGSRPHKLRGVTLSLCDAPQEDRTEAGEDREDGEGSRVMSGEKRGKGEGKPESKRRKGRRKCCLNEGPEALRGREGRLRKCGDAETRGSGGCLSHKRMLHSVGLEVPRSSPRKGTVSLCRVCY